MFGLFRRPSPIEEAVIEVMLASLRDRPWEWKATSWRVVNQSRHFSIWCPRQSEMAYDDTLDATWAKSHRIPRKYRAKVWEAIRRLAAVQTVRRFQDDGQ